ncbi:MAG: hypothetical protein R3F59_01940 [Myxococcota bacterium]
MDETRRPDRDEPRHPAVRRGPGLARAAPLPVDAAQADAAARRLAARLQPRARWRLGLALGLGLAACAAAAGLAALTPTGPPEPAPVEAPAPTPPVPEAVRDALDAEDWLAAWQAEPGAALSEADLRRLALGLHRTGQQTQDPATLEAAAEVYELYLARFPQGAADAQMRYAYAELLYATSRYAEAYDQYLAVADRHPDSPHAAFCAESAVHAAQEQIDPEDPALEAWEERLVDAVDLYVARWPDDPKGLALSYTAGHLLLTNDRADAAVPLLVTAMAAAPDSREAAFAAALLVDAWGEDAVGRARAAVAELDDEAAAEALAGFAAALAEDGRDDEAAQLE